MFSGKIFQSDDYLVYKYAEIDGLNGKRKFKKGCCEKYELKQFAKLIQSATKPAGKKEDFKIYTDQVVYSIEAKEELLELLKRHITMHFVSIEGDVFRQRIGIPQGSIVSSLLCRSQYFVLNIL
jgi:telomerase reverse transcriptase